MGLLTPMKYYSEEKMRDVRLGFEERILRWPKVSTKKRFGCPSYQARGKLFAFLVTKGVVITQLSEANRETLLRRFKANFFGASSKVIQNWMRINAGRVGELDRILPFVRKSYYSVLQKP